jgi:sugar phosphate isomerase/epimerase
VAGQRVVAAAVKIACADFSFPLLEHDQALTLIRMLGIEGVDLALMGNRSHVRPEQVRENADEWIQRLRDRVEGNGLELADLFVIPWTDFERLAPNHPDRDERAASRRLFEEMSDVAVALAAGGMTFLPGIHWQQESWDASFERAVEELSWRVEQARRKGLRISIEPHFGSIVTTPAQVLQLIDEVPALELTLDYTHFIYQGIPEQDVDPLLQHARHFHARGATPERLQATLRANTIDYDRILDLLLESGYDGYIGIEYVWTPAEPPGSAYDMTNTDNLSETILLRDKIRAHRARPVHAARPALTHPE